MRLFKDSTVLITGGTGSFGSCLFKRLYGTPDCPRLAIYSRDEKKQWDMAKLYPNAKYIVGDVRDYSRLRESLEDVDYVFHAAAYKQVPVCESNPMEAIKTNVQGAMNLVQAAIDRGVKRVVGLSTDKAVHPINTMGFTKALQEKMFCYYDKQSKNSGFINVRYGNVLGSRGSVVPLFMEQVSNGLPCSITDERMTRFLLTLDDAVTLVLTALTCGTTGVTLVNKMPASTVLALCDAVQKKMGKITGYRVVGIRGGEKLHESLISEDELPYTYDCGSYFMIDYNKINPNPDLTHAYTSNGVCLLTALDIVGILDKAKISF